VWVVAAAGRNAALEYITGVKGQRTRFYNRGWIHPVVGTGCALEVIMIRKLKTGEYRLYSRKLNPKTGKKRNLGTFKTREAALRHERAVQYFKRR